MSTRFQDIKYVKTLVFDSDEWAVSQCPVMRAYYKKLDEAMLLAGQAHGVFKKEEVHHAKYIEEVEKLIAEMDIMVKKFAEEIQKHAQNSEGINDGKESDHKVEVVESEKAPVSPSDDVPEAPLDVTKTQKPLGPQTQEETLK